MTRNNHYCRLLIAAIPLLTLTACVQNALQQPSSNTLAPTQDSRKAAEHTAYAVPSPPSLHTDKPNEFSQTGELPISRTEKTSFSLIEAWRAAQQYAATHHAAEYARDAAQEPQNQAKAQLLPHISANANYSDRAQDAYDKYRTHGWNIQLVQPLYDKAHWAQYQAEKITAQLGEAQLQCSDDDLMLEVAKAYFEVLAAQEKLKSLAEEKTAYQAQIQQTQGNFQLGQGTILDTYEAQANYDAAVAKIIKTQTDLTSAQNKLAAYTGHNATRLTPIKTGHLPDLSSRYTENDWIDMALANSNTLRNKQLEIDKSQADEAVAKSGHYPQVSLTAGYQDNHNNIGYTNGSNNNTRNKGTYVGIQFTLPLYSGGETSSKIRQQEALVKQKQAEYRAEKEQLILNVKQQYTALQGWKAQIAAQEKLLATNQAKLEATKLGNQYGMSYPLEILQAEKDRANAAEQLQEAKYQYITTWITLLQLSGLIRQETQINALKMLFE